MYVYNTDEDTCREVIIKPDPKWAGEGSLGCGIGYGYLHRIPVRIGDTEKAALLRPQQKVIVVWDNLNKYKKIQLFLCN